MKIGIITWFKGSNFGTNLQAIALQRYLRNEGHEVKIINYEVVSSYMKDKRTFWQKVAGYPQKCAIKYATWKYRQEITKRDQKITNAVLTNCILTDKIHDEAEFIEVCNSFELLICGSDQIWNPNWYHRFYFADYDEIKTRRVSYAPSLGVNVIPDELKAEIKRSIEKFDEISVREERAALLLASNTRTKPTVVVDPTFLLSAEDWKNIFPSSGREHFADGYVLSMFLTDKKEHWKAACRFARKKGGGEVRHVIIPYCGFSYLQNGELHADAGLEDMLELMRGAHYILTDSFHITVFSIIHHKQFYTFQRFQENEYTSQNVRVSNLLKIVELEERFIPYGCKKIHELEDIVYSRHEEKLHVEIQKSKDFLRKTIEGRMKL